MLFPQFAEIYDVGFESVEGDGLVGVVLGGEAAVVAEQACGLIAAWL